MTHCYLGVSLALNHCTWTSQLSELSSELHLGSLMLLLLSSSWAEDSVKSWMIRAGIFFGRAEEIAASLRLQWVLKALSCYFSKCILSSLDYSNRAKLMLSCIFILGTQFSIPWGHHCTTASWPWTETQLPGIALPSPTKLPSVSQNRSGVPLSLPQPGPIVSGTNKHPSYPIQNQTNISKVSICLCFTQIPKAIFTFPLISLNPLMQMHGKCFYK